MPRFMIEAAAAVRGALPRHHALAASAIWATATSISTSAPPPGTDPARWYAEDAPVVTRFVDDLVVAAGGSISAEHGIGQMKRDELERLSSPARMAALRAIKAALDPHGILNPGKLVTLAARARAP